MTIPRLCFHACWLKLLQYDEYTLRSAKSSVQENILFIRHCEGISDFTGYWSCEPEIFYRTEIIFIVLNQVKVFQPHLMNKTQNITCFLYLVTNRISTCLPKSIFGKDYKYMTYHPH